MILPTTLITKSLSLMLQVNTTLTELDLSGNTIGDVGCKYLSDGLKENRSLTMLNLKDNAIKVFDTL